MAEGGDLEEIESAAEEEVEHIERIERPRTEDRVQKSIILTRPEGGPSIYIKDAQNVVNGNITINHFHPGSCKKVKTKPKKPLTTSTEPLTTKEFQYISNRLGSRWKNLGRCLGWDDCFLEQLDCSLGRNETERNFQMLLKWTQEKGDIANRATLARNLANSGLGKMADYLHKP